MSSKGQCQAQFRDRESNHVFLVMVNILDVGILAFLLMPKRPIALALKQNDFNVDKHAMICQRLLLLLEVGAVYWVVYVANFL